MSGVRSDSKLSPAQQRMVDDLRAGAQLLLEFDVWKGDYYSIRRRGFYSIAPKSTVEALLRLGVIVKGEKRRVFSGHHETPLRLSDDAAEQPNGMNP